MGISRGNITTNIIKSGLVFNMDAANRASYPKTGTTAIDTVGNVSGTLTNDVAFSNTNKGIFTFDGTDDYVAFNNISSDGDISISCWVYLLSYDVSPSHNQRILHNYDGSNDLQVVIRESSVFKWGSATKSQGVGISDLPPLNEWINICLSRFGTTYKVYYNSQEKSSVSSTPGNPSPSISQLRIGADIQGSSSNGHLEGKISNVQIYNRALSSTEVAQNYNALKSRFE